MQRPGKTGGMRHVALFVDNLAACETFYVDLLGMEIEWRPDDNNVYLTSGNDNLALHHADSLPASAEQQRLDHIGFIIPTLDEVDDWFAFLQAHDVKIRNAPRTHRDGARSFYCYDPSGTLVQIIYHPPIS